MTGARMASYRLAVVRALFPGGPPVLGDSIWTAAGMLALQGSGTLVWLLLARILSPGDLGGLGMVMQAVVAIGVPAGFGLGITSTRLVASNGPRNIAAMGPLVQTLLLVALAISAGIALVTVLVAPWIAGGILGDADLSGLLRVSVVLLVLNSLLGVLSGCLLGFVAFRALARMNILRGALQVVCVATGAFVGGPAGGVTGFIIAAAGTLVFALRDVRKIQAGSPPAEQGSPPLSFRPNVLWTFSLPVVLSALLTDPVMWLGNSFLAHEPGGHAQVAIVVVATSWRSVIMFAAGVVSTALLPRLTMIHQEGKPRAFMGLLVRSAGSSLVLSGIPGLLIFGFAGWMLSWYGESYAGESLTLQIVSLAGILAAVNAAVGNGFVASGRMYLGLACNIVWAAVFLVSASAWVHRGAEGIACAYVAAYAVHTVVQTGCVLFDSYLRQEGKVGSK